MNHVEKGHYYEQEAADYLISCGYRILETNYRCRHAEIDLIAMDGDYLVLWKSNTDSLTGFSHPLKQLMGRSSDRSVWLQINIC